MIAIHDRGDSLGVYRLLPRLFSAPFIISLLMLVGPQAHAADTGIQMNADKPKLERPRLLDGSWRDSLQDHGVTVDAWLTQFHQGSSSGDGRRREWQYGGKTDIFATFDGGKLGLLQGLYVNAHAELLYGQDANIVGNHVLLPVDTALALPHRGGSDQDLSIVITQAFNERISASIGKFNMLDVLAKTPLMGGGGTVTFMNMALAAPITGATPPYLLGASVTIKTDPIVWTAFIYDPRNAQKEDVLRSPFSEGATGMLSATMPYQIDGLGGFLSVKAIYTNKEGTDLADVPSLFLPAESDRFVGSRKGGWFLGASFQQYLVQNPNRQQDGWGIFGQIGISDGNPNPIEWSAILGVSGSSFLPNRNLDRWGVGYFRYSVSSDLQDGLGSLDINLRDEQGIEAFYSVAMSPWFSVTSDLQVVQPILAGASTAVTTAVRTKIKF